MERFYRDEDSIVHFSGDGKGKVKLDAYRIGGEKITDKKEAHEVLAKGISFAGRISKEDFERLKKQKD